MKHIQVFEEYIGEMTKVNHQGYKGYTQVYKGTSFVVWNAAGDWYIDVIDTDYLFNERELSQDFKSKKLAIANMQYLIDKAITTNKVNEEQLISEGSSPFDVRWDAIKGKLRVQPSSIVPNRDYANPPVTGVPVPGADEYWETINAGLLLSRIKSTEKSFINALFQLNYEKFPELISWSPDGKTYQMRTASGDIAEFVAKQNVATRNVILYRILDRNGNEIVSPEEIMDIAQGHAAILGGDPANQANNAAGKHSAIRDYLNAKRISPADFQKLLYDYERPLKKSLNIELRGLKNLLKKI